MGGLVGGYDARPYVRGLISREKACVGVLLAPLSARHQSIISGKSQKEEHKKTSLFIVDAALLIEAGYHNLFNSILLITAEASIRINRIKERNNIPHDQIKKRMNLQMSENQKRKHADIIIENNLSKDELFNKLDNLLTNYNLLN